MSETESMMARLFKIKNVNASFVRSLMIAHSSKRNDIVSKQLYKEPDSGCQSNNKQVMKNMIYKDSDAEENEHKKDKQIRKQDNASNKENAQEVSPVSSKLTSLEDVGNSESNDLAFDGEQFNRKRDVNAKYNEHIEQSAEINRKCSDEIKQSITLNARDSDLHHVESELLDKESNRMLVNNQSTQIQEQIRAAVLNSFNRRGHSEQETQSRLDNVSTNSETEYDYIIFTTGSKAYTPHQIGIKKIKPLPDGIAENKDGINVNGNTDSYDEIDHIFEMDGHITGLCVSPDQRYLYVNCRAWPENYEIADPFEPPSISNGIDMHVIDLQQMHDLGVLHRGHKAYTINQDCFYTHLDVADDYVASGAEDKQGYLWDRHYGICVRNFPHDDVVSSVAFSPTDPEVLVTVSDDWSIKIWRSLNRQKQVMNSDSKSVYFE